MLENIGSRIVEQSSGLTNNFTLFEVGYLNPMFGLLQVDVNVEEASDGQKNQ